LAAALPVTSGSAEAEDEVGTMGAPVVAKVEPGMVELWLGMPEGWAKPDEAVVGGTG
jgi:hypothetical protein